VAGLLLFTGMRSSAQIADGPPGATGELRMGFSKQLFREFNSTDGLAATRIWLQTLINKNAKFKTSRTFLLDGQPALEQAERNHDFDVVMLLSVEYLQMENKDALTPWFTYRRGSAAWDELALITPADGATTLKGLRGKRLLIYASEQAEISDLWLESQLREQNLPEPCKFFSSVGTGSKPMTVVLPVFFGQCDACIVNREAFNLMGELNPQVRKKLVIRALSPPMQPVIICAHRKSDPQLLKQLHEDFATAQEDRQARQVLTTYGLEKLDLFDPVEFENLRQLVQRQGQISSSTTPNGTVAPLTPEHPN
jgi:phosphonate transport system substrate-binding protein